MTPTANLASAQADADHLAAPATETGPFVLNLCSSTTPMALAQTDLPELKRFTFFVSRRFEEGRERFRLHMGFFASQTEAEEWLGVVRDIYPGAWAGEAPGKKLRARAAEAAATQARHAVGPQKTVTPPPAPVATSPAPAAARPQSAKPATPKIPTLVPTLHPPAAAPARGSSSTAPSGTPRPTAVQPAKAAPQPQAKRSPAPAPSQPRTTTPPATRTPAPAAAGPRQAARPATHSASPQQARPGAVLADGQRAAPRPASAKPAAPAAAAATTRAKPAGAPTVTKWAPQARAAQQAPKKPIFADSNVKEVLAALDTPQDGTGQTRVMQAPAVRSDAADDSTLTDTQVLRFLEIRREEEDTARSQPVVHADAAAESGISLLKPDDTGTRRALKEAVSHNDPVSFAVQLQWSVQPVELDKVPPLAIFSAYTLYSVEGSREGRKWYGLRLGFFNDAISAKQVAYYVRSEFASVAVVPVSPQERGRATEDNQRFSGAAAPRKRREAEDNEFKLIDSDTPAGGASPAAPPASQPAQAGQSARPAAQPTRAAASPSQAQSAPAAPAAARKSAGKVGARERRTPQTLEETLEILGANELAIDTGTGESLNDTGVRHLSVEVQKNTPFSRLLERLSERVRKA